MKTIEVTDEMYEKLMELSKEMTTQDMRATKMPHMFQIRTEEDVAAHQGCGDDAWVYDGSKMDDQEIKEFIINQKGWMEEEEDEKFSEMEQFEREEVLEENGCAKYSVTTEQRFQNTFFTAKACQEHIDQNHYHYTEPDVYLNHAWRNPEMELVSEFLCGLTGKTNHT